MTLFHSAWLIGSVRDLPEQEFEADGAPATLAAGDYYLIGPSTALSLAHQFALSLQAAGVDDAAAVLTRSRKIKLTASESFTVDWGTATRLRDLLGFDDDLASLGQHIAPLVSPLLWSPGKPTKSELSPHGIRGMVRPLSYFGVSPADGSATVVTHGSREFQRLSWTVIENERIWTAQQLGGEFVEFFAEVLAKGASLYHYPDVFEDSETSTTMASIVDGLGPYVFSPDRRAATWVYDRTKGFDWTDRRQDIDLSLHVVPQYET